MQFKSTSDDLRIEQQWLKRLLRQKLTENLVSLIKSSTIEKSQNYTASSEKR